MNRKLCSIIILMTAISLISCSTTDKKSDLKKIPAQHKEEKRTHKGKAVISEIAGSKNSSSGGGSGYVDIYFNFIPSDPHAPGNYLCSACPDRKIRLFYDNRESFHSTWVMKWGIKPGKEYTAVRHELARKDGRMSVTHEVFLEPEK